MSSFVGGWVGRSRLVGGTAAQPACVRLGHRSLAHGTSPEGTLRPSALETANTTLCTAGGAGSGRAPPTFGSVTRTSRGVPCACALCSLLFSTLYRRAPGCVIDGVLQTKHTGRAGEILYITSAPGWESPESGHRAERFLYVCTAWCLLLFQLPFREPRRRPGLTLHIHVTHTNPTYKMKRSYAQAHVIHIRAGPPCIGATNRIVRLYVHWSGVVALRVHVRGRKRERERERERESVCAQC